MQIYELKIEIGFSGGTMSLFKNQNLEDEWINESQNFRSDFLLEAISKFLLKNEITPNELKKIVIADNILSQTANKSTLATLKGISVVNGTEICVRDVFASIGENYKCLINDFLIALQVREDAFEYACVNETGNISERGRSKFEDLQSIIRLKFSKKTNNSRSIIYSMKRSSDDAFEIFGANKLLKNNEFKLIELEKNLSVYL